MRVLSWNIAGRRKGIVDAIRSASTDILLLQEVTPGHKTWVAFDALAEEGLSHRCYALEDPSKHVDRKGYGSAIFSRWPLSVNVAWKKDLRFPESMARATIHHPEAGDIDVFSVHIPNGSGNGWLKIDHVLELGSELVRATDGPRIVAGDFNEPKEWRTDGRLVPFAYGKGADGGEPMYPKAKWTSRRQPGKPRELAWWDYGVRSVLDGERMHGLRHVFHDRHGYEVAPVTHRTRANPRFFDHGFVSRHFEVVDSGYKHAWRKDGISDHSALWFELRRRDRADLPPLVRWSEES